MKIYWDRIDKDIVAVCLNKEGHRIGLRMRPPMGVITILPPFVSLTNATSAEIDNLQNNWTWRPGYLESQIKREPNWDEAPEWAEWWAVNANGKELWYEKEPTAMGDYWFTPVGRTDLIPIIENGGWRKSLRKRPVPIQKSDAEVIAELRAELTKKEEEIERLANQCKNLVVIDWPQVPIEYNWIARDEDGKWYAW